MSAALRSFEAQWRARTAEARTADALQPLREQAMQRFLKLGLPTMRDETWRYTDLRSVAAQSFEAAPCEARGAIDTNASLSLLDATQHAKTVVMINGCPSLKGNTSPINGITISSIRELSRLDPKSMLRFFPPASDADQRRWVLLNIALFIDGLYLKITQRVTAPLVILHVSTGDDAHQAAHPRIIIDAAPGSSATIIEHHVAHGEIVPLNNSNTHISLARDAQ